MAVPDDLAEDGYGPCPTCVIDAGETWVVWDGMTESQNER